jgi:hypothetical protein
VPETLFEPFFEFKSKAMFPGGKENLKGGQILAFYPKDSAGSGEGRFPAYFEILALKAVGGF